MVHQPVTAHYAQKKWISIVTTKCSQTVALSCFFLFFFETPISLYYIYTVSKVYTVYKVHTVWFMNVYNIS